MSANTSIDQPTTPPDGVSLVCGEIHGGNRPVETTVDLPGVRGVIYSRPCDGGRGGDVHYLSVCGSGLLTRMCVADVAGHGEAVAGVSAEMHQQLRRLMNWPDQRRVLRELNTGLVRRGLDALTTAVAVTYYPPSRRLSYSYAGHPPAWHYQRASRRWRELPLDAPRGDGGFELRDAALAVTTDATFGRGRLRVAEGDRLLLFTDGVVETPDPDLDQFGIARLASLLASTRDEPVERQATKVLEALTTHAEAETLDHDDVTILLVEFTAGPRGPALWHVLRNRILPRRATATPRR